MQSLYYGLGCDLRSISSLIIICFCQEIRRRKQLGGSAKFKEDLNVSALEMQVKSFTEKYPAVSSIASRSTAFVISKLLFQVAKLKQVRPVPFDILISQKTRVLIITGPNTGGKTICLKTVGLAAMMAKSGMLNFCVLLLFYILISSKIIIYQSTKHIADDLFYLLCFIS